MLAADSKTKDVRFWAAVLLCVFFSWIFSACALGGIEEQQGNLNNTPTVENSITHGLATSTPNSPREVLPIVSAAPTLYPTRDPLQSTPEFEPLAIAKDILFTPSDISDCVLPCWQGLQVGRSNSADIQRVFDDVLGFDGTIDFFQTQPLYANVWQIEDPDIYTTGYEWYYDVDGRYIVGLQIAVDQLFDTLEGIRIRDSREDQTLRYSPQKIIQELGTPDYIFAMLVRSNVVVVNMDIMYDNGLTFAYIYFLHASEDFCLNDVPDENTYFIFPSISDPLNEPGTVVQEQWQFEKLRRLAFRPIEEVLDLTASEFAAISQYEANPCLEIPLE